MTSYLSKFATDIGSPMRIIAIFGSLGGLAHDGYCRSKTEQESYVHAN